MTHLFVLDVATRATRALTSGAFTVGSFAWSPDGKSIAFDHRVNGSPASSGSADISIVTVADGAVRKLVTQDGPDTHPVWSPDGSRIAFEIVDGESRLLLHQRPDRDGARRAAARRRRCRRAFDEDPSIVAWKPSGLFFSASAAHLLVPVSPGSRRPRPSRSSRRSTRRSNSSFSLSRDGAGDRVPSCRREVDGRRCTVGERQESSPT